MQEKDLLQKAMQQKNMMVLYRDELVAPEYAGVPVAVENELVVLQRLAMIGQACNLMLTVIQQTQKW